MQKNEHIVSYTAEPNDVIVTRPALDDDRESIATLLKWCDDVGDVSIARDNSTTERFRRSLVACQGDTIVAYGSIFSRPLHPARLRLQVFVSPGSRNNGIGQTLVESLIARIPENDGRDLQANYWQSDEASAGFWNRLGFAHLMRTRIGTLDPSSLPDADVYALPAGVSIATGVELDSDRAIWGEIVLLHEAIYRRNHRWNPPAPIDLYQATDLFLQPADLIPDALFVALQDGLLDAVASAVASLRPGGRAGRCELGWIGARDPDLKAAKPVTDLLLHECFVYARARNWLIDIEADDADPVLSPLADAWPLQDRRTWMTVSHPRCFPSLVHE